MPTPIETNTINLQELKNKINALPETVSVELITATVNGGTFYYQDIESGGYKSISSGAVKVAKGSACVMSCGMVESIDIQGSYKNITFTAGLEVFQVLRDVTVSTYM